ncbi:head-tail connector protein [Rhodobacter maris]|uniref:Uncharacterized phage protein (Predicted DNA packaging)/uncharacterized phiE125 gp8 family phage protein n=1 Tax=Rhodobacter maris TaxID=446682 RepID=A0A285TKR8_9RHOB|nr:head-tail connector protein [Rhodobacter maris]SOC23152.1 uncharacterized phage protein (predicted DNA packaging)/uncharacterized phiE125 gp8 family phage protein [Rhodobacter maris]
MSSVTLPELKAQLNLDHDLDDALLSHLIDAAEAYAASFTGARLPDPLPATIRQAVLMLAAFWYETREAALSGTAPASVPFGVHELLQAHRAWVV